MSTITNGTERDNPGHFRFEGGELTAVPGSVKGLYWCTQPTPADFVLKLEWQYRTPNGRSGVLVRFPDPDSRGYHNTAYVARHDGLAVKINQAADPDERVIYNCPGPQTNSGLPNKWNKLAIWVKGQCYTISVNGAKVARYTFL